MPTWPRPSKKTRSPGCSEPRETGVPYPYCAAALCGSETPTCAKTYIVKPEQSKPEGEAPPQTYGVPRYCIAIPTTPPWVGGGGGTGAGAGDGDGDGDGATVDARACWLSACRCAASRSWSWRWSSACLSRSCCWSCAI